MDQSNSIIQSLWVGQDLSTMEQLSIRSFLKNGHDYHLYTYGEVNNIPAGTTVKDGNEILPAEQVFTQQTGWGQGSYTGFADLFRYHLLRQRGGWWADTDVICLKPFDFESDCVIASSQEGEWGAPAINCVLKMPQNSELAIYLSTESSKKDLRNLSFGELGPHLLQKAIADLKLQRYVVAPQAFCPITWRAVKQRIAYPDELITPYKIARSTKAMLRSLLYPYSRPGRVTSGTYAVHLWNEIWRQNQLNKNARYHRNCWYERLKAQYL